MLRSILAVVLGIVAASVVVFAAEMVGHALYPTPSSEGHDCRSPKTYNDQAAAAACVAATPFEAKVAVVVGWFLGVLIGGVVAALVGRRWAPLAWVVAVVIFLFCLVNFSALPHPAWMIAASVFAVLFGGFCATSFTGAKFALPKSERVP
ncbi:MAG: hypothetical protein HXY23_08780 [Parvularculaceae bacterium]|nr:hypothetical protein [Parvularculaceae bacterium]